MNRRHSTVPCNSREVTRENLTPRRRVPYPIGLAAILTLLIGISSGGCSRETVTIAYFYSAVCPSCAETQMLMDLAGSVHAVSLGNRRVTVKTYDLFHDPGTYLDLLRRYFEAYEVPSNRQSLPILFAGEEYYQGSDEIQAAVRIMQQDGPPKHGITLPEDSATVP